MRGVPKRKNGLLRRLSAAMLAFLVLGLSGCARLVPDEAAETLSVYASFYPIYALTALITADVPGVETHCLVQPQEGCLRNYELSDWDLYTLGYAADAVVIGGRGLESFEAQLYAMGDEGPAIISAFSGMELYNDDGSDADAEDASHWDGENPHAYMSIECARTAVETIAENLALLDPEHAELYAANLASAQQRFEALEADISQIKTDAGLKVILLNEALVYSALDLSLEIDGWYARESGTALSENEFADFLDTVADCEASVVLLEKQAPQSLVKQLETAGYRVARLDVLSEGREDWGTERYFSVQLENTEAVQAAFSAQNKEFGGGNP